MIRKFNKRNKQLFVHSGFEYCASFFDKFRSKCKNNFILNKMKAIYITILIVVLLSLANNGIAMNALPKPYEQSVKKEKKPNEPSPPKRLREKKKDGSKSMWRRLLDIAKKIPKKG
ncbi:hypothetical protein BpHYR1_023907 [Brachionus plicatilis]|uniref:Uncharacterized protein n=1 Tax=Brachionus plicatilis TaxID=10195 RepID=A0A3M7R5H8_BRAPC|nr:hypothetical protein BpHYR1_023907 [Brachionus plicatilis]